jgi:uncharacterized BrkB/YihY/UPF0761 family membrane protein
VEILAFLAAVVCALVALVYALPMVVASAIIRFVRRRWGLNPPPFLLLAAFRLRWTPVLVWGGLSLLFFWLAFTS